MSFTIVTPTKLCGARSPIYVSMKTSDVTNFQNLKDITLNIKVWSTTYSSVPLTNVQTLTRDQFVAGTNGLKQFCVFDIAPIVAEHHLKTAPTDGNTPAISPDSTVLWCRVDFNVNYFISGNEAVQNATGSSTIFPVSMGYNLFDDAAFKTYPSSFLTSALQSNAGRVYVKESGDNEMIGIYMGAVGSADFTSVAFAIAGGTHTIDLTAFRNPTEPEGSILRIPIGVTNLSAYLTSVGYSGTLPSSTAHSARTYTLQIGDDILTMEKVCEPKYDIRRLRFINRFGAWDYLYGFKASSSEFQVTRQSFQKATGSVANTGVFTYDKDVRQDYNVNGLTSTTINTGFVDESYKEVIKDLLMSESVYIDVDGTDMPVKVVDTTQSLQKSINDKMINYTIQVQEAFTERYV
jgi:hypothetical protein|tara:strand:+ start:269 stop:1486 length:1218 start_codon:yes stop_codon:yes gene_type:complete